MQHYRIMLSAPSDVTEFVEVAKRVVASASLISEAFGVRLDTFDWADVATPGVSTEPQAVINEQSSGYSALVAILGTRVGSPTLGYDSGTIEEVEGALAQIDQLPFGGSSVMVFFSSRSVDIRTIDPDQIKKIHNLRANLGSRGVLYKDFENEIDLQNSLYRCIGVILSRHINRTIEESNSLEGAIEEIKDESGCNDESNSDPQKELDDDLGILDLDELGGELMRSSADRLNKISQAMKDSTEIVVSQTTLLEDANARSDAVGVRKALSSVAESMEEVASIIDANVPFLKDDFIKACSMIKQALEIQAADIIDEREDVSRLEIVATFEKLIESNEESILGTTNYAESVRKLPRLTKKVNVAKRRLSSALDEFVESSRIVNVEAKNIKAFIAQL